MSSLNLIIPSLSILRFVPPYLWVLLLSPSLAPPHFFADSLVTSGQISGRPRSDGCDFASPATSRASWRSSVMGHGCQKWSISYKVPWHVPRCPHGFSNKNRKTSAKQKFEFEIILSYAIMFHYGISRPCWGLRCNLRLPTLPADRAAATHCADCVAHRDRGIWQRAPRKPRKVGELGSRKWTNASDFLLF